MSIDLLGDRDVLAQLSALERLGAFKFYAVDTDITGKPIFEIYRVEGFREACRLTDHLGVPSICGAHRVSGYAADLISSVRGQGILCRRCVALLTLSVAAGEL